MSKTTDMVWFPVDTESMAPTLKAKYQALQKANEAAKEARDDFQAAFLSAARKAEKIDSNMELAFGYRFGKLAIAKIEKADRTPAKQKTNMFTF